MKSFESWAGGTLGWLGDGTPGNARRLPALWNEPLITTGHGFATYEGMHLLAGNAHERHCP